MSKIPDFKLPKIDFKGIDYGLKHQTIDYSKIKVDVTTYYKLLLKTITEINKLFERVENIGDISGNEIERIQAELIRVRNEMERIEAENKRLQDLSALTVEVNNKAIKRPNEWIVRLRAKLLEEV